MRRYFALMGGGLLLLWGCRPELVDEQVRHRAIRDSVWQADAALAQYLYDSLAGRPLPPIGPDTPAEARLPGVFAYPYVVPLPPVPGADSRDNATASPPAAPQPAAASRPAAQPVERPASPRPVVASPPADSPSAPVPEASPDSQLSPVVPRSLPATDSVAPSPQPASPDSSGIR